MKKVFDSNFFENEDDNIVIPKALLQGLLVQLKTMTIYNCKNELQSDSFILIDKNLNDAYPFSKNEISDWEKDGSFEVGDMLFKLEFVKQY